MGNNMEHNDKKSNIVKFPHVENLLVEKAYRHLKNNENNQALSLLEEAKRIEPNNEHILVALLITYVETGLFEKAKEKAQRLLQQGIGDYFQVVDLYLTSLLELEQYSEIQTVIETLLDVKVVPQKNRIYFLELLEESKRLAKLKEQTTGRQKDYTINISEILQQDADENSQLLLIKQLSELNIRPHLEEIKRFLKSEQGNAFIKTMLLHEMKEQEIRDKVTVTKLGMSEEVVPIELTSIQEDKFLLEIQQLLSEEIENDDPILFNNINSILERSMFLMYPIVVAPKNSATWAAAFHILGVQYFGGRFSEEEIANHYGVDLQHTKNLLSFLEKIEGFSGINM